MYVVSKHMGFQCLRRGNSNCSHTCGNVNPEEPSTPNNPPSTPEQFDLAKKRVNDTIQKIFDELIKSDDVELMLHWIQLMLDLFEILDVLTF